MLTLSEVRYWYYHLSPEDQKRIQKSFEGFKESELEGNSIFEQMRDVFSEEIEKWYE